MKISWLKSCDMCGAETAKWLCFDDGFTEVVYKCGTSGAWEDGQEEFYMSEGCASVMDKNENVELKRQLEEAREAVRLADDILDRALGWARAGSSSGRLFRRWNDHPGVKAAKELEER